MSEDSVVRLVALIGWLILVGSAFASYRLSWRKGLKLALIWAAIFLGVYLLFSLVAPQ